MNPVVHFEMPAGDKKRMMEFYSRVFGWKTQMLGPEMGEYVTATTTEVDDKNMPKKTGAINGGFFLKTEDPMSQYPSIVIAVDDIQKSMKDVQASGGTVHGEPEDIPGIGKHVSIVDTEGNRISLLQPIER